MQCWRSLVGRRRPGGWLVAGDYRRAPSGIAFAVHDCCCCPCSGVWLWLRWPLGDPSSSAMRQWRPQADDDGVGLAAAVVAAVAVARAHCQHWRMMEANHRWATLPDWCHFDCGVSFATECPTLAATVVSSPWRFGPLHNVDDDVAVVAYNSHSTWNLSRGLACQIKPFITLDKAKQRGR